jgi:PAS domain S-box-containing protein
MCSVRAGERLRPEELGFGRLFEMIRDAVIVADAKTQRIVLWNAEAAKMFGYSASEALKLRVEELVLEPLKDARRVGITRYAKTGHGRYIDSDSPLEGA